MMRQLLFLFLFPLASFSQECPSISSLCKDYEIVEYVLVGRGDTTAVVSRANLPLDMDLSKPKEIDEDDDGVYHVYHYQCLRIIYMELNDGRIGTTISKL